MKLKAKSAFSITELSIVMLIIGFLIASTFAYQNTIKEARRRYVINEFKFYDSAINNFRTKYVYLPGDYPAVANSNTPMNNVNPVYSNYSTVPYGNGNNQWDTYNNGTNVITEYISGWAHLSAAKFISGGYFYSTTSTVSSYGTAVPPLVYGVDISMMPYGTYYSTTANYLSSCYYGCSQSGGPTTLDSYYIDQKMDDGVPSSGQILTYRISTGNGGCTSGTSAPATYNLTEGNQTSNCLILFVISAEDN